MRAGIPVGPALWLHGRVPEPGDPVENTVNLADRRPSDAAETGWPDPGRLVESPGRELVQVPHPEVEEADDNIDPARRSDVDHWGRSEHLRALSRRLYDPIYRYWFRTEWEGLEHLPPKAARCSSSNHAGAIPSDAPAIMHGIETELGRPVYGMAEYLFRAMPVVGTLWSRGGGIPAHPDNAYRLLHDEQQLALVFPEGSKATGKLFSRAVPAPALRARRLRPDRDARRRAGRSRSRSSAPRSRCRSCSRARGSRRCSTSPTSPSPPTC